MELVFIKILMRKIVEELTDIISLSICYYDHALGSCIITCSLEDFDTLKAVHLIVSDLRLYCRDNVANCINKLAVKVIDGFCSRSIVIVRVFLYPLGYDIYRYIFKLGIKAHYRGVIKFLDPVCKCISKVFHMSSFLPSS